MIVRRYEDQGIRGFATGRRGRPVSSNCSLTADEEEHIQRLIRDHRPEPLKMDFALWTRAAVMLLIERECAIELHVRSAGKYLTRGCRDSLGRRDGSGQHRRARPQLRAQRRNTGGLCCWRHAAEAIDDFEPPKLSGNPRQLCIRNSIGSEVTRCGDTILRALHRRFPRLRSNRI
jgi:hypothetical protein